MDNIDQREKLFQQVNLELLDLLQLVGEHSKHEDGLGKFRPEAIREMDRILTSASRIGGKLFDEAKILKTHLSLYLEQPSEEMRLKIMQGALRIKHEVGEI